MENSMVHSSFICMIYIKFDRCKLQQEGFESWFSNKNRTFLKFKKEKEREKKYGVLHYNFILNCEKLYK